MAIRKCNCRKTTDVSKSSTIEIIIKRGRKLI